MTRAGRAAVALLGIALLALLWGVRAIWRSGSQEIDPSARVEPPSVSAPPPPARVASAWIEDPPRTRERFSLARTRAREDDPAGPTRLVEWLDPIGPHSFHLRGDRPPVSPTAGDVLRVEYTLDAELTDAVFEVLRRGRVERGEAIVMDPRSGRLLAYVTTDPGQLPPERAYPAASIVKILTAAALLEKAPEKASTPCVYRGNKYRLSRRRLDPPKKGNRATLEQALATSNNQCFAQWAVHAVGEQKLFEVFERFGWLASPALGHEPGEVEAVSTRLDLGRLGSGLDGLRVNPLHIATLGSILTDGRWIEPWWVERVVDVFGRSLELPSRAPSRRVLSRDLADRLRAMLVATTRSGTARSAFRTRRGRPLLGGIEVAGKTGNLSGRNPSGRYEWFMGLAPADDPSVAVVVLQLQSNLWWAHSSELGARILRRVFCDSNGCRKQLAERWMNAPERAVPSTWVSGVSGG